MQDWVYIGRLMKMMGYSNRIIQDVFYEFGWDNVPRSTLHDALSLVTYPDSELPLGYKEYRNTAWFTDPPKVTEYDNISDVINCIIAGNRLAVRDFDENCVIYRGENKNTSLEDGDDSPMFIDETESVMDARGHEGELPSDSFSFWSGDNHKSSIQRYLDYQRRSNNSEGGRYDECGL